MSDRAQLIEAMHAEYVRLSGQTVTLMGREWAWNEWIKRGLGLEELRLLIGHIKRERAAGRPVRGADLKFRNLVGNADFAEEDVIALRARMRGDRARAMERGPRAEVLRATGRPAAAAPPGARRAGDVASAVVRDPGAAQRAFEQFQKLKEQL